MNQFDTRLEWQTLKNEKSLTMDLGKLVVAYVSDFK